MKVKTGIDIIEVSRIKENIENYGEAFLNRVFTKKEIEYCEGKKVQRFQSYAGRFAAKEAVFKAVSELLDSKFDILWKDIEVLNDENGRPFVNVESIKKDDQNVDFSILSEKNVKIDISISHIKEIAIASVVLYQE